MSLRRGLWTAGLALGLGACGQHTETEVERDAQVTVGLRSELRAGVDIGLLKARLRSGAGSEQELRLTPSSGLRFPLALDLGHHAGGAPLELSLEAFFSPEQVRPLLSRKVKLQAQAGRHVLVPLRLEVSCAGLLSQAPECPDDQTCIAGDCADPAVDGAALEDYEEGWEAQDADRCKPVDAGAPEVLVGEGQVAYQRVEQGEAVQVEAGPQGGHHVWIALRARNLLQSGSVTTVRGSFPALGITVPEYRVIFGLQPSEGGACELAGLRFQLDAGLESVLPLLGQELQVEVEVRDPSGSVGLGRATLTLSTDILG